LDYSVQIRRRDRQKATLSLGIAEPSNTLSPALPAAGTAPRRLAGKGKLANQTMAIPPLTWIVWPVT
jgi:hypothetical protein